MFRSLPSSAVTAGRQPSRLMVAVVSRRGSPARHLAHAAGRALRACVRACVRARIDRPASVGVCRTADHFSKMGVIYCCHL